MRLAGALYYFWFGCGEAREGRYWLERALAADPQPSRERVRALAAHASCCSLRARPPRSTPARESVELARRFNEPFYEIDALHISVSAPCSARAAAGLALLEQAVALASELATRTRRRWHSPSAPGEGCAGEPAGPAS